MAAMRDANGRFIKGSGSGSSGGVTDRDLGWSSIREMFKDLENAYTAVGIHGDAKPYETTASEPAPPTVAEVASKHEFGDGVPQRAFLRPTVDANRNEYVNIEQKLLGRVIAGKMKLKDALGVVGEKIKGDVQQAIVDLKTPPLAESTIEAKVAKASYLSAAKQSAYREGGANPLIDTGHMRQSVTYSVVINGQTVSHPTGEEGTP